VKINKIWVNFHKILLKFTKIRMDFQLTKFFGEFYMIFFLSVEGFQNAFQLIKSKASSTASVMVFPRYWNSSPRAPYLQIVCFLHDHLKTPLCILWYFRSQRRYILHSLCLPAFIAHQGTPSKLSLSGKLTALSKSNLLIGVWQGC
jgi:hypothetical protein